MNLNAANGSFQSDLPDSRHSVLPPELPVCSKMWKQTGSSRPHPRHTRRDKDFQNRTCARGKSDILAYAVTVVPVCQ